MTDKRKTEAVGTAASEDITQQPEQDSGAATAPDSAPVEMLTPEAQLAEAETKAAEYLDGWQRARAELDNYRKRMSRERSEWNDMLRVEFILGVLPAVDDFDLALASLPEDIAEHAWVNGVILAHRKLVAQLEAMGLSEIETAGQSFDPALHEAVTHEESKDHHPGEIIAAIRKGYRLGEKVIRVALVRVAS